MSRADEASKEKRSWGTDDSQTPILHVDMDAFFVEAELLRRPELRGSQVIVGGYSNRGVVSSASYPARALGVHAGMPVSQALRLAPKAIVIPTDHKYYSMISKQVMEIFKTITPVIEPISIDEAFLDVSGARRIHGSPVQVARKLRATVREQLGLPASVGIARNKLVSKIASTRAKPDGLLLISADQTERFLAQLPVGAMWGIGQATEKKLRAHGITMIGQLAELNKRHLMSLLGKSAGESMYYLARGIDRRPVAEREAEKSIGSEITFEQNIFDTNILRSALLDKSHQCAARLRAAGWRANTVTLKLRAADFSTWTRSRTFDRPTDLARDIYAAVDDLLSREQLPRKGIRLIGVTAKNLTDADDGFQLAWNDNPKDRAAEEVLDQVHQKYGSVAIKPASLLALKKVDNERSNKPKWQERYSQ